VVSYASGEDGLMVFDFPFLWTFLIGTSSIAHTLDIRLLSNSLLHNMVDLYADQN
jgi:hypothetical protein